MTVSSFGSTVTTPLPPDINVFTPVHDIGPTVPIRLVLSDPQSQPVDVRVQYSVGGSAFRDATPAVDSDRMTHVPAPCIGADYRFIWDAEHDVGQGRKTDATLQFTPIGSGGTVTGPPATVTFHVDTTRPQPPQQPPRNVYTPIAMTKTAGDSQSGVAGRVFAQQLQVTAVDASKKPLVGARVTFAPLPGAHGVMAPVAISGDATCTTDANGNAFATVRAATGASGTGVVRATVAGVPSVHEDFTLQIGAANIRLTSSSGATLEYGQATQITVSLEGPSGSTYGPETNQPLILTLSATNGALDTKTITIDRRAPAPFSQTVWLAATTQSGTITVTCSCAADPTLDAKLPLQITVSPNTRRWTSSTAAAWTTLSLRFVPGKGALAPTLVGYDRLTLATPFSIDGLVDEHGASYTLEYTGGSATTGAFHSRPLQVTFMGGGTFSTTPAAGGANRLTVPFKTPVYFTPAGRGPWQITASVDAQIVDPAPIVDNVLDKANHLTFTFTFVVQAPDAVTVQRAAPLSGAVTELDAGDSVFLQVDGLSPVAAGTPGALSFASSSGSMPV